MKLESPQTGGLDAESIRSILFWLLTSLCGLLSFEYFRISGEFDRRFQVTESRLAHIEEGREKNLPRLASVEDAVTNTKRDIDGMSKKVDNLADKIDHLNQQLYESHNRHGASFSELSLNDRST